MALQAYFIESCSLLHLSHSILTPASKDVFQPNNTTKSCYERQFLCKERSVVLVLYYAEYGRQHMQVQLDTSLTGWQKEKAEILCESGHKSKELGRSVKGYCLAVLQGRVGMVWKATCREVNFFLDSECIHNHSSVEIQKKILLFLSKEH